MNVVSLFDGISCARVALGNKVAKYYAAEIEPNAIKVAHKNFPDTIHLGDVKTITKANIPVAVDLLIGGSPCTDLSIAKKGRKGLEGEHSGLFKEYVRLKKELNPRWFILENVASMPRKDRDIITANLGVEPIMIDAALVSAQSRRRLFWTNIPNITLPQDRGIKLKDILQNDVEERFYVNRTLTEPKKPTEDADRELVGCLNDNNAQANRVYTTNGKSVTLSANGGGLGAKTGLYITDRHIANLRDVEGKANCLTSTNYKGSQANGTTLVEEFPKNEIVPLDNPKKKTELNWSSVPYPIYIPEGTSTENIRVGHEIRRKLKDGKRADNDPDIKPKRRIETRNDDKCGTLTTVQKDNQVIDISKSRIRRLTPVECERLQSLPDNYTEGIAMTNRYKCLGNAFNVEVIRHILTFLPVA
jgi:DNA-cytosine methyltransferase